MRKTKRKGHPSGNYYTKEPLMAELCLQNTGFWVSTHRKTELKRVKGEITLQPQEVVPSVKFFWVCIFPLSLFSLLTFSLDNRS